MDEEIKLDPSPGFVVKTQIVSGKKQGKKTFINICSDSRVPEPQDGYGPEILDKVQQGEDYVVPIVLSHQREDVDKAGKNSFVWDCCMHPKVIIESIQNSGLRILVIETCLELIENSSGNELSREFALPKMLAKGKLEQTLVRKRDLYYTGTEEEESVTRGIDDLARKVISGGNEQEEEQEELTQESMMVGSAQASNKKPLIQVLSENDVKGDVPPQLSYKINKFDMQFSGAGNPPRYRVEIMGADENDSLEMQIKDEKLLYCGLEIKIPGITNQTKIEAFYVKEDGKIHTFIF